MAEILKDENPRKDLYRMLLADKTPGVADKIKKYSFNQFEKHLLSNEDAQNELGWYLEKKGVVSDPTDFSQRYIQAPQAPPAPKPQAAPVAPAPIEQEPYVPKPQPAIGSPEYDAQLQAQYQGMTPTLGATFGGVPAAFETKAQKKQEQISPAFKAQKLAFEDVPIAEEQRRAQKQFAKATKEQQQAALRGGTGFELQQERANEARESTEKLKDFGSYIGATFDNMIDKAKGAERIFAAKQRALLTFGDREKKAEEEEKRVKQQIVNYVDKLDQDFAAKQADYNIEGNLFDAIRKGQWDRIPEAFAYNLAQVGIQALAAAGTGGYSMFAQVFPDMYKAGVEEIAKKTKTTPEQVIASGNDKELLSYIGGGISGYIEYLSGGILGKAMRSEGAYKFLRDKALDKIGKTKWKQAAASAAALGGVSGIEGLTEVGQGLTEVVTPQIASADTFKEARENIYKELQKPETQRRLAGEFVGGAAGGGGIAAGGRALSRALEGDFTYGDVRKATQRADYDVVQADNKITERNKISQAMEEAVKANPEAEEQIRQQYQKRINEAAPTDGEVLSAYESLSVLPETEEKNAIRENLEAYMTEKGIAPQAEAVTAEEVQGTGKRIFADSLEEVPVEYRDRVVEVTTGPLSRFGVGRKQYSYVIPAETIEVAPEAPVSETAPIIEEAPVAEEAIPVTPEMEQDYSFLEETELTPEERAALLAQEETAPVTPAEKAAPVAPAEEEVVAEEVPAELVAPEAAPEVVAAAPVEEAAPEVPAAPMKEVGVGGIIYGHEDIVGNKGLGDVRNQLPEENSGVIIANGKDGNQYAVAFSRKGGDRQNIFEQTPAARPGHIYTSVKIDDPSNAQEVEQAKKQAEAALAEILPTVKGGNIRASAVQQAIADFQTKKSAEPAPAPKAKKAPAPKAETKQEAPKTETKKEEAPKTEAKPVSTTPEEGDAIQIAPQREGGSPRNMVFKDGEWRQNVGGDMVKVGPAVQQQAQEAFAGKEETKPAETKEGKKAEAKEEKVTTPEFTSQQSSEAATAFDKAKTSKGFDKKYGKGAYKTLSDITKNFEDIMDKVSEKIKQDCIV